MERILQALVAVTGATGNVAAATATFRLRAEAAIALPELAGSQRLCAHLAESSTWAALFGLLVGEAIESVADPDGSGGSAAVDELQLGPVFASIFRQLGHDDAAAWRLVGLVRLLRHLPLPSSVAKLAPADRAPALVRAFVADEAVRPYLQVNVWEGVSWFNRESFEQLLWWMLTLDTLAAGADKSLAKARLAARLIEADRLTATIARAGEACSYQLDKLEDATTAGAGT